MSRVRLDVSQSRGHGFENHPAPLLMSGKFVYLTLPTSCNAFAMWRLVTTVPQQSIRWRYIISIVAARWQHYQNIDI